MRILFWSLLLCLLANVAKGQTSTPPDTNKIQILYIDNLINHERNDGTHRDLFGQVHLQEKQTHFWCDTAYLKPNEQLLAFGDVQLLEADSVRAYSDTLRYNGLTRKAQLRGGVVLQDSSSTIYTEVLNYDLNTKTADFPTGALIESDSAQLLSKRGSYNTETAVARFEDSVRLTHPRYKLMADSLEFNTKTEVATFLGPTFIYNEDKLVYCETGYFDSKNRDAEFGKNAYYLNRDPKKTEKAAADRMIYDGDTGDYYLYGNAEFSDQDQQVKADTIIYRATTESYDFFGNPVFSSKDSTKNQRIVSKASHYDPVSKTMFFDGAVRVERDAQILEADSLQYSEASKMGRAKGSVHWQDTVKQMDIVCGEAEYADSTGSLLAYDRPVLRLLMEGDSLWLIADTLFSRKLPKELGLQSDSLSQDSLALGPDSTAQDTIERRELRAYHHVQIFKSNLQGRCDSLHYSDLDSMFWLFEQPVLWADSTQFTADTIAMRLKNEQIERMELRRKALIVRTQDQVYFSQIAGRNLWAYFYNNELERVDSDAESRALYYLTTETGAYVGVNKVEASRMRISIENRQVGKIRFFEEPNAVMYPMQQVNHEELKLPNFDWKEKIRPKQKFVRQNAKD